MGNRRRSSLPPRARAARTELVAFRLRPEDRAALEAVAREQGITISELLRHTVEIVAMVMRKDGKRIRSVSEQLGELVAKSLKEAAGE